MMLNEAKGEVPAYVRHSKSGQAAGFEILFLIFSPLVAADNDLLNIVYSGDESDQKHTRNELLLSDDSVQEIW